MPEQSLLADMAVPVALSLAQLSHAGGRETPPG